MTTWAEAAVSAPDWIDLPGVGAWVSYVSAVSWGNAIVAAPEEFASSGAGASWVPYDLSLLARLFSYYGIDSWNADQPKGVRSGVVRFPNGGIGAGVMVRLCNRDQNRSYVRETVTDAAGTYSFADVPGGISGLYFIEALAPAGQDYPVATMDRVTHDGVANLQFQYPIPSAGLLWPRGDL